MNSSADHIGYQVRMETRQWLFIDATLDSEVNIAVDDGDPRGVVDLGNGIRRAGCEQNPGWPHDLQSFETWPAPGQKSTMTLSGTQWSLVISALRYWAAVSESTGAANEAAESRTIADLVHTQLTEQGWSPPTRTAKPRV